MTQPRFVQLPSDLRRASGSEPSFVVAGQFVYLNGSVIDTQTGGTAAVTPTLLFTGSGRLGGYGLVNKSSEGEYAVCFDAATLPRLTC